MDWIYIDFTCYSGRNDFKFHPIQPIEMFKHSLPCQSYFRDG